MGIVCSKEQKAEPQTIVNNVSIGKKSKDIFAIVLSAA